MNSASVYLIVLVTGQVVNLDNATDIYCLSLKDNCLNFQCDRLCDADILFACKTFCKCQIGYGDNVLSDLGYTCKENCSNNPDVCRVKCKPGFHGQHCSLQCNTGCKNGLCDRGTGYCLGCERGKYGETCLEQCRMNCLYDLCEQYTGRCTFGCQEGFYGPTCAEECPGCYVCHPDTGTCLIEGSMDESNTYTYTNMYIIVSSSSIAGVVLIILSSLLLYRCCKRKSSRRVRTVYRPTTRPPADLPNVTHGKSSDPHYDVIMERISRQKCRSMTSIDEGTDRSTTGFVIGQPPTLSKRSRKRFRGNAKSLSSSVENLPSCWVGGPGIFELFDIIPECDVIGNKIRQDNPTTGEDLVSTVPVVEDNVFTEDMISPTGTIVNNIPGDGAFSGTQTRRIEESSDLRTHVNTSVSIQEHAGVLGSDAPVRQDNDKTDRGSLRSEKSCVRKGYISAVYDQSESLDEPIVISHESIPEKTSDFLFET